MPANPVHYADRLQAAIAQYGCAAVVGIDPLLERLPPELRPATTEAASAARAIERFGETIISAVRGVVPAVKINIAFFEAFGERGVAAYFRLIRAARAAGLLVIGDIKRGDIGSTAALYARGHLGGVDAEDALPDAVTVSGYLGVGGVQPFIELARQHGRGLYVLVRPSDPGADAVHEFGADQGMAFYQFMAGLVRSWGAADGLCGACGLSCVGAVVAPKDVASTAALRAALPTTPLLVPGYGAQGGAAEACRACFLPGGRGAVVNASRSVIYAYEEPRYRERCGADWRASIAQAARDFAADVAAMQR